MILKISLISAFLLPSVPAVSSLRLSPDRTLINLLPNGGRICPIDRDLSPSLRGIEESVKSEGLRGLDPVQFLLLFRQPWIHQGFGRKFDWRCSVLSPKTVPLQGGNQGHRTVRLLAHVFASITFRVSITVNSPVGMTNQTRRPSLKLTTGPREKTTGGKVATTYKL